VKRKERGRGLSQIEATEVISIAEYLNTSYNKQDQIVDNVKNHESNRPNMNAAIRKQ